MLRQADRKSFTIMAFALLLLAVQGVRPARADSARLILTSTDGQPILDHIYQTPADTIGTGVGWANGIPIHVTILLDAFGTNLPLLNRIELDTSQLAGPIQPGTYLNAQRYPFEAAGHPALSLIHGSSGANTLTGSFTINALTYSTTIGTNGVSQLTSLSASFVQYSDGNPVGIEGVIYYPATIPEPGCLTLAFLGFVGLGIWGWRRRNR
jgi:hypothetical protein